jgi:hypothetical protein
MIAGDEGTIDKTFKRPEIVLNQNVENLIRSILLVPDEHVRNECMQELIRKCDVYDSTALHFVCRQDNPSLDVIEKLCEYGGKEFIMVKDAFCRTALDVLCIRGTSKHIDDIICSMMLHGYVEEVDLAMAKYKKDGQTALYWLCNQINPPVKAVIQICKSCGNDSLMVKDKGYESTVLHIVCKRSNPSVDAIEELCKYYMKYYGNEFHVTMCNLRDGSGMTPLHVLGYIHDPSMKAMKKLCEYGGKKMAIGLNRWTALHFLCTYHCNPSIECIETQNPGTSRQHGGFR